MEGRQESSSREVVGVGQTAPAQASPGFSVLPIVIPVGGAAVGALIGSHVGAPKNKTRNAVIGGVAGFALSGFAFALLFVTAAAVSGEAP